MHILLVSPPRWTERGKADGVGREDREERGGERAKETIETHHGARGTVLFFLALALVARHAGINHASDSCVLRWEWGGGVSKK